MRLSGRPLAEHPHRQSDRVDVRDDPPPHEAFQRVPESPAHDVHKLGLCAERRWRRLSGFRKLGKVVEGVQFKDGIEAEHPNDQMAA